jgi:hypothetical protein
MTTRQAVSIRLSRLALRPSLCRLHLAFEISRLPLAICEPRLLLPQSFRGLFNLRA